MHLQSKPHFNRRIYFISGFDPRGARYYHRLFREEAKKSEALSGAHITTSKCKVIDADISQWQVDSAWNGQTYHTDYRFMHWDDVMKQYWESSVWRLVIKSFPLYCQDVVNGLLYRFKQAGKGAFLFAIMPFLFIVASLISAILMACLIYVFTLSIYHQTWLAAASAIVLAFFTLRYAIGLGERMGLWWVAQSFYLQARWRIKPLPRLEQKMQAFAHRILQDQLASPVEETILVGHCTGAALTVCVAANILDLPHDALKGKLSVLTLGQCIPYISYAPQAHHFRQSLQRFADNVDFPWYDMGARNDPLCFQQVNPALADGIVLKNQHVPYRFVVKPFKMFSAEKYQELQKSKLRIHFQYLMSADIKTDYDYFEIVTGAPNGLQKYRS